MSARHARTSIVVEPSAEPPGFTVRRVPELSIMGDATHLPELATMVPAEDEPPDGREPVRIERGALFHRCHLVVMVPHRSFNHGTGKWDTHRPDRATAWVHQDLVEMRDGYHQPAEAIHHQLLETLWGRHIEK